MENLPARLDLICELQTGRRLTDQQCAGFGRCGADAIGAVIWYSML
jgi:hypothetical protein